jgi:hypothetical protein
MAEIAELGEDERGALILRELRDVPEHDAQVLAMLHLRGQARGLGLDVVE